MQHEFSAEWHKFDELQEFLWICEWFKRFCGFSEGYMPRSCNGKISKNTQPKNSRERPGHDVSLIFNSENYFGSNCLLGFINFDENI